MNAETIKLLIQLGMMGVQAYNQLQALKTSDPVQFEAALQAIGGEHSAMLAEMEAAAAP